MQPSFIIMMVVFYQGVFIMKYALFTKLGGEIIDTSQVDYEDHKYFLKCPNCKELVFLRKKHIRKDVEISSAFIHHKAIPEVSVCEIRVNKYSTEYIEKKNSIARGQRIDKLKISMWKYIKTSIAIDCSNYYKYVQTVNSDFKMKRLLKVVKDIIIDSSDYILETALTEMLLIIAEDNKELAIDPARQKDFELFVKKRKKLWMLHSKIAKEAMELILRNKYLDNILERLLCCFIAPDGMDDNTREYLIKSKHDNEFIKKITAWATVQMTGVFATIDWIDIFE